MAGTELNRRLSTQDASFLYVERPNQPMHLGSCSVYEGHVSRADVIRVLEERIHLLPRYRQKAVFAPFGLAHPTWEDDPDFDASTHVEEVTLPAPGDDQVLSEVGGQLFGQMLDRNRPLWRIVLLHGRADGNTASLLMVHHAMVDGISGVELMMVLHDLKADAEPSNPAPSPWQPKPLPDPLSLLQDAIRDQLVDFARTWTAETFRLFKQGETEARRRELTNAMTSSAPALLRPAPATPFNGPLSTRRQFAWAEFSFAEIRSIRSALGGTINDVVLAVLSGALGRYLRAHGYPTDGVELRAMCPVSMRRAEERGALGNLVSMLFAPLYVGIADPIERLNRERSEIERLKQTDQAGGLYAMTSLANMVPPAFQAASLRFDVPNTLLNTVSTNVPGPQIPLYLSGHALRDWYPLGPLASSIGLFNAILSYNQKLTFGATVDPTRVPDVWFYVRCLKESFAELLTAAQSSATAKETPVPVRTQIIDNGSKAKAVSRTKTKPAIAAS
ncbi:MAG: WS/DGAT/MGAT family O-acyltransferase [Dehalococcoidia bacterium]